MLKDAYGNKWFILHGNETVDGIKLFDNDKTLEYLLALEKTKKMIRKTKKKRSLLQETTK